MPAVTQKPTLKASRDNEDAPTASITSNPHQQRYLNHHRLQHYHWTLALKSVCQSKNLKATSRPLARLALTVEKGKEKVRALA